MNQRSKIIEGYQKKFENRPHSRINQYVFRSKNNNPDSILYKLKNQGLKEKEHLKTVRFEEIPVIFSADEPMTHNCVSDGKTLFHSDNTTTNNNNNNNNLLNHSTNQMMEKKNQPFTENNSKQNLNIVTDSCNKEDKSSFQDSFLMKKLKNENKKSLFSLQILHELENSSSFLKMIDQFVCNNKYERKNFALQTLSRLIKANMHFGSKSEVTPKDVALQIEQQFEKKIEEWLKEKKLHKSIYQSRIDFVTQKFSQQSISSNSEDITRGTEQETFHKSKSNLKTHRPFLRQALPIQHEHSLPNIHQIHPNVKNSLEITDEIKQKIFSNDSKNDQSSNTLSNYSKRNFSSSYVPFRSSHNKIQTDSDHFSQIKSILGPKRFRSFAEQQ